ncbi:MAG TPA: hypothetical protein VK827_07325 [Lysobacter sp.]|nr:hypothetical protein [Lysobacter sp.]
MRTGTIAALAVGIGLAGCATHGNVGQWGAMDEGGARCGLPPVDGRVFVEIRYAGDGTPSAVPEECTVAPGTRITWRGPEGTSTPFVLRFAEASPAGRGEPRELASEKTDVRQEVMIIARNVKGRYKYGIEANGIMVDPAIIIDQ